MTSVHRLYPEGRLPQPPLQQALPDDSARKKGAGGHADDGCSSIPRHRVLGVRARDF